MEQFLATFPERIERTFEPGQVVLRQGERRGQLYVLAKGSVEIIKSGITICTVADEGAIFGELSVLLHNYHNATVRAADHCTFYIIDKAEDFLNKNPQAALHVARVLARRLSLLDSYFTELKKDLQEISTKAAPAKPAESPETELFNEFWDKAEKGIERRWHLQPDPPPAEK